MKKDFRNSDWWLVVTGIVGLLNIIGSALSLMDHRYFWFIANLFFAAVVSISFIDKVKKRRELSRQRLLDELLSDSKPH